MPYLDNSKAKNVLAINQANFKSLVQKWFYIDEPMSKLKLEKAALQFGITDKTMVKEIIELAIIAEARSIALQNELSIKEKFENIVKLYQKQAILSHRTSDSIRLQQYSTPAPIAYLMGVYAGINTFSSKEKFDSKINRKAFEPSAGNGMLLLSAEPKHCEVNEIDSLRLSHLKEQGFFNVYHQDGNQDFSKSIDKSMHKKFDAVLTNPPFGRANKLVLFGQYKIESLAHQMAIYALQTMKDDGKAAIIIGGHTEFDERGRIQAGSNRLFFSYLYSHYFVEAVIPINGHTLYSKQGTGFPIRLILINGRKIKVEGYAPLQSAFPKFPIDTFQDLYNCILPLVSERKIQNSKLEDSKLEDSKLEDSRFKIQDSDISFHPKSKKWQKDTNNSEPSILDLQQKALQLEKALLSEQLRGSSLQGLAAPYIPTSDSCNILDTVAPDAMTYEMHEAMHQIKFSVGGDIDEFVRDKLGYSSKSELCEKLSAEQIDAVAMAIYNIEAKQQGCIIGDQTGIGKGRIAAAMIRYGVLQGLKPIFLTEKTNLFSDLYRDLKAIGSVDLKPFIVNAKESKSDIKDENGLVIFQADHLAVQQAIFESGVLPKDYHFVLATYSQFNSLERKPTKPEFLKAISKENIAILDESHNSSGLSNTGVFMQNVVKLLKGIVFLSATFAKRADNMPVYALKTAIQDANMNEDDLIKAILNGGVALQEVLASQLVEEGQMIRRERSFEGVEVNYITLEDKQTEHFAIADNLTEVIRDIIEFQKVHIDKEVAIQDEIMASEYKEAQIRQGTREAGVGNEPYFSKVFQVIHQMLFSIKAEAVAELAIERLKQGKKPVIAFASTMGSFLEEILNNEGLNINDGQIIKTDFSTVLNKGLDSVMRYTVKDEFGNSEYKTFSIMELSEEAQKQYFDIQSKIKSISTGISISPIDVIRYKLQQAGYSVAEVTGRKYQIDFDYHAINSISATDTKTLKYKREDKNSHLFSNGIIQARKRENTNDAFRRFNDNDVDVLLINQSGSTGASAHAIPTPKVKRSEVKQRVMIVLQAELDINTEVQKRGRINRTGQILKPIYDYVNSAIPAEKRLMMMLQKKLKSLDANTSSNQKQSNKILDVPDFLNKYGDKIVKDYLIENPRINYLLNNPLHLKNGDEDNMEEDSISNGKTEEKTNLADAAHKVSGRVAVLSTKMQQDFYLDIAERYIDYVDYLKQIGEYDLELEALNLEAQTKHKRVIKVGKGTQSVFGEDSYLETIEANVLKKPFSVLELKNILKESLSQQSQQNQISPKAQQQDLLKGLKLYYDKKRTEQLSDIDKKYNRLVFRLENDPFLNKLKLDGNQADYKTHFSQNLEKINGLKENEEKNMMKRLSYDENFTSRIFNFFYVGKELLYPDLLHHDIEFGEEPIGEKAIFLGYQMDLKKENAFLPSKIKLKIAFASSKKYLSIPTSFYKEIYAIMYAGNQDDTKDNKNDEDDIDNTDVQTGLSKGLFERWEEAIQFTKRDRNIRYMITGNVLQAFSDFKGKLVNYTTINNGAKNLETKKGILMSEIWQPKDDENRDIKTVAPIIKTKAIIIAFSIGQSIETEDGIGIIRQSEQFKISVPASKVKGSKFYLNLELLKYILNHRFEKSGDRMQGFVLVKDMGSVIECLQKEFNTAIALSENQMQLLQTSSASHNNFNKRKGNFPKLEYKAKPLPKLENADLQELELQALALALELELLDFIP
jgi:P-loop containing NTP hydrolase pore-1/C-terminal domain on Strawberry notch homologue